jgi:hypothetical protein
MVAPSFSRATQGEMHQPQDGSGSPRSRAATISAMVSPPPALSPTTAM